MAKRATIDIKGLEKIVLKREIGSNILDLVCNLATNGFFAALDELIANMYDSDAAEGRIDFESEAQTMTASDNGTGMTPEGLRDFYRVGDSPKAKGMITPIFRRPMIGKFGIGTSLLNYLCHEYVLVTEKDGIRTEVHEVFDGPLNSNKKIPFKISETDPNNQGTSIKMINLKFEEGEDFTIKDLKSRIQWGFLPDPNFQKYIDGEFIEARYLETATTFKVDEIGKHMGHVKGEIHYLSRTNENAGLHVYVNSKRVGDPKAIIDWSTLRSSLTRKVVGVIKANDMDEAILFDRGRLNESHPGYKELQNMLRAKLTEVDG
ncbi:MAG: ATP-binding protein, partial [Candidatus Woesearchaeota archaeon]